jgi:hypothetical protein
MYISEDIKKYVWDYMLSLPKKERPYGCTDKRLQKILPVVFSKEDFWDDIVWRHGINNNKLSKLKEDDIETYNHCVGNFW